MNSEVKLQAWHTNEMKGFLNYNHQKENFKHPSNFNKTVTTSCLYFEIWKT
jgi:hypothetical protein